jgi:hypothetical protein
MRPLAALILLACVVAALAAANRSKPMLVDAGFHRADYPVCVTVVPGPLVPPRRSVFNPKLSEKV